MGERESREEEQNFIINDHQDTAWEERLMEDMIWEGGIQSPVIPRNIYKSRSDEEQIFHPDLTKHWD